MVRQEEVRLRKKKIINSVIIKCILFYGFCMKTYSNNILIMYTEIVKTLT
jgi:hypothetical protein